MTSWSRFTAKRDRVALSNHVYGHGEPDVVLIHGLGDGGAVWQRVLPWVSSYGRVIVPDLRGHGDSGRAPTFHYSLEDFVSDMLVVIDALRSTSMILVGHSLGADVAIRVAVEYSSRVRALALVDGGVGLNQTATAHARKLLSEQAWHYSSVSEYALALQARLPLADPSLLQRVAVALLNVTPDGSYELKFDRNVLRSRGDVGDSRLRRSLAELGCPILLARGIASAVLPERAARAMTKELPTCTLKTIPAAGHAVVLENPRDLGTELCAFLDRLAMPETVSENGGGGRAESHGVSAARMTGDVPVV